MRESHLGCEKLCRDIIITWRQLHCLATVLFRQVLKSFASKHEMSNQCWFHVGPPSQTVVQHGTSIGSKYLLVHQGVSIAVHCPTSAVGGPPCLQIQTRAICIGNCVILNAARPESGIYTSSIRCSGLTQILWYPSTATTFLTATLSTVNSHFEYCIYMHIYRSPFMHAPKYYCLVFVCVLEYDLCWL